ncbi:MAG: hypothetical protein GWO20_09020, partial [Candidatus Korarchaeota archaeon]|nr:hypothetical protein [Candidatus Korarchaeota archaeon]
MGRYRIEVNVGTHIVPFEGSLYYFNKLLNPKHLHQYAETLGAEMKTSLAELKNFLKDEAYFYAMRQGTRKLAFISLHHPIEISPFFKTEQDTGRKIVHATGTIGKKTKGFQHVTMEPINLSDYELNPQEYQTLDHTGKLLTELLEKAPLIEELEAREEELRVVRSKTHELADEV